MNKRITSLALVFVMVLSLLVTAVPALAAPIESTQLKVTADKTSAKPGDTITYTITMGPVSDMGSMQMCLDIPTGLTYVENSTELADGLKTTLGFDDVAWTEISKMINGVASAADYESNTDTVIAKFRCTVDADFSGTAEVGLTNLEFGSCQTFEYHTDRFSVVKASVTVTVPHSHVYDQEVATAEHLKTAATCTAAAVYYKSCTCGENGTETFTSGSALGHDYTKKVENNTYLKTAASNCTEYNVYWYACSRCDANAKDDAAATDKYYTSTTAGNHSFTEKIEDAAHYVAGTGTDCQSVKKYYYDCAYCDLIGTNTWDSTTYGPHNYAATWSSDADGHWHECSLCHGKKDEAAHTPGAAATETTPQKCTECDYIITPALGHTHHMTPVAANPATCTEDGNKAYYVCSGCSKWFEDATGKVEITDPSSVVIGHPGHDFAPATCTTPKTCRRCDATEGSALGHNFATVWSSNATKHWHACSRCDAKDGEATHTPDHQGHATEEYAIKCTECGYEMEAQLVARTPVTNIAATVTAPALGQKPDYAPVIVANPADSVDLKKVDWCKIAAADFPGTDEDDWDKMASDETFTTGYYYSVNMYFDTNDGYKMSESTTGTVNGMHHDDTYGGVYDSDSAAYLCGLFGPLETEYTIDLPFSLAVKLTGDEKPAKETFKFEIYDLGVEDAEFEIVKDSITAENIAFDENGVAFIEGSLKIKVTGEDQLSNLTEGFSVRMVKGSTKGWTYASEQWRIEPSFENDAVDLKIAAREIVDGEISEAYANGMSFSVGYEAVTEPETPQTGDSSMMVLWIALFVVSGAGATAIYSRKRKSSAK